MSEREPPRPEAGRGEGAESGPAGPPGENAPGEAGNGVEIPIGMPVPAAEWERLKAEAERHRDQGEDADAPEPAGDAAGEEEGDDRGEPDS